MINASAQSACGPSTDGGLKLRGNGAVTRCIARRPDASRISGTGFSITRPTSPVCLESVNQLAPRAGSLEGTTSVSSVFQFGTGQSPSPHDGRDNSARAQKRAFSLSICENGLASSISPHLTIGREPNCPNSRHCFCTRQRNLGRRPLSSR